jgi:hypothetical protein
VSNANLHNPEKEPLNGFLTDLFEKLRQEKAKKLTEEQLLQEAEKSKAEQIRRENKIRSIKAQQTLSEAAAQLANEIREKSKQKEEKEEEEDEQQERSSEQQEPSDSEEQSSSKKPAAEEDNKSKPTEYFSPTNASMAPDPEQAKNPYLQELETRDKQFSSSTANKFFCIANY